MQQRQPRLGDILDDYCPRERRVTNHAVVAMIGDDIKQTRCTTCDAEHEYKHAKVPRQRRKTETPAALYAQVAANAPKRVAHEPLPNGTERVAVEDIQPSENVEKVEHAAHADAERAATSSTDAPDREPIVGQPIAAAQSRSHEDEPAESYAEPVESIGAQEPAIEPDDETDLDKDEGPVHRPLIRASLPRPEGQQPPQRPIPEFTIRQPGGRPNRFRPRHQRGGGQHGQHGQHFQGNRSNGNMAGPMRGPRPNGGRPGAGMMKRHGPPGGRKRSK